MHAADVEVPHRRETEDLLVEVRGRTKLALGHVVRQMVDAKESLRCHVVRRFEALETEAFEAAQSLVILHEIQRQAADALKAWNGLRIDRPVGLAVGLSAASDRHVERLTRSLKAPSHGGDRGTVSFGERRARRRGLVVHEEDHVALFVKIHGLRAVPHRAREAEREEEFVQALGLRARERHEVDAAKAEGVRWGGAHGKRRNGGDICVVKFR